MKKKSFEDALTQLEKITTALESGELSLEDSLNKFEEGIKLAEFCSTKLEDAQAKVEILLKKGNALATEEFIVPTTADSDTAGN